MSRLSTCLTRSRTVVVGVSAAVAAGLVALGATTAAGAGSTPQAVPPPPAYPTSARQIQNIDQVRTAIKGYYGDTVTSETDPIDHTVALHEPSAHGAYAAEVRGILRGAQRDLAHRAATWNHPKQRAIVLDVDDTSLVTYNYEIYSNFAYNPSTNGAFVDAAVFPKVFGMTTLARHAEREGYTIFWLTGRPGSQQQATLDNLSKVGYPGVDAQHLFLKDYDADTWLSSCAPACTTIQYKSLTREHIQSLGYRIVANFGDQFSDLSGGYALRAVKLPNPMYYLP